MRRCVSVCLRVCAVRSQRVRVPTCQQSSRFLDHLCPHTPISSSTLFPRDEQVGGGGARRYTNTTSAPSPAPLHLPPPCAQRHKQGGDIETDISPPDERGISVTQASKVNVVWVRKQLLVYCEAAGRLKGTITPPKKAIKGSSSVHTSDKLFAAPPRHKDA